MFSEDNIVLVKLSTKLLRVLKNEMIWNLFHLSKKKSKNAHYNFAQHNTMS